ncbi:MAG: GGDEF domain-containing protein [Lachnospiraceae bacterium]|nr:GGDEF domain-containing protein [Lachnospiraceae bacterium]
MEEIEKLQYQDELKANKFSTVFLAVMCGISLLVCSANEIGIFVVNRFYMRLGIIIGCICLLIPMLIFFYTKGRNRWFKYVLIVCVSFMAISIQTFLTFHGVMLCVLPVLLAAQYIDTRVFRIAFSINLVGVFIAVLLGYYIGCWDGNMVYATTYGITLAEDSFAGRAAIMNAEYMKQLLLYFALPRMVIFSVISISISYILKNAKLQYVRQNMIRIQAECDGLTRLENRTKYNQRVSQEYKKLDSIYIVFLDVNFLKKMNDTCGHEAGDSVLKRVADEMRRLIDDTVHGYRLGGDEFALVFCNYSEEEARNMIKEWEKDVEPLNRKEDPVHCSLAIGGAYGCRPFDMETLLKEADENMYERKKAMKAHRQE